LPSAAFSALQEPSLAFFQDYINDLRAAARDKNNQSKIVRPELEQLANDWSLRTTPYANKPTTPNECRLIEEETNK
jgi:predicted double-glycine peptidase